MLCHILQKSFLALAILPAVAVSAFAQTPQSSGCDVPDDMKNEQKLPCLKASSILVEQPTLTMAQLTNGPDFDAAQPDATRFKYFTDADTIRCYFRPHYAFQKVPGDSMKFQCWQMTADGGFFSKKGQTISVNGVRVVISSDKSGEKSAAAAWVRESAGCGPPPSARRGEDRSHSCGTVAHATYSTLDRTFKVQAVRHMRDRRADLTSAAVEAEERSPRLISVGPAFRDIANTPGITAIALRAFLTSSHPRMPNLILTPEETGDVIAYILSLRDR